MKRKNWLLIGAIMAAITGVAAIVYFYLRDKKAKSAAPPVAASTSSGVVSIGAAAPAAAPSPTPTAPTPTTPSPTAPSSTPTTPSVANPTAQPYDLVTVIHGNEIEAHRPDNLIIAGSGGHGGGSQVQIWVNGSKYMGSYSFLGGAGTDSVQVFPAAPYMLHGNMVQIRIEYLDGYYVISNPVLY